MTTGGPPSGEARTSTAGSLWARRWVRRLTYVLAAGASLGGLAAFLVSRPAADRWILGRLDAYVQEETGLTFQAERLEVHPFEGRILLHRPALGGDLFRADLVEVDLEWRSLPRQPHLRLLRVVNPALILDRARLAGLRLKPHPPARHPLKVRLDRLDLQGGQVRVAEPAWGLPAGACAFQATGRGRVANQLDLEVRVPYLALGEGQARLQGQATFKADVSDRKLTLERGALQLGHSGLTATGSLGFTTLELRASVPEGHVDLGEVLALAAPGQARAASGSATFALEAQGPLDRLRWKAQLTGRELKAQALPLRPGTLQARLSGQPRALNLEDLHWTSQDGRLEARGGWTRGGGTRLEVEAGDIALAPAAAATRTDGLNGLKARFRGTASLPGTPWEHPRLAELVVQGEASFLRDGDRVGGLTLGVAAQRVRLTDLRLELPEGHVQGSASATLGRNRLERLEADADLGTDAGIVAAVMKAWDIGMRDDRHALQPLDMSGRAHAWAHCAWDRNQGFQLAGHIDTTDPRWHGATADTLSADVAIDRDELRLTDLQLTKGAGFAAGELWLTWADLPPGAEQLDMCYRATRLPIEEGLRAGDQGDLPIRGLGSGWARLHGTFDHILAEGRGVAEQTEAYGFTFPAGAADFTLDLDTLRLRASDARVADTLEHLAPGSPAPTGALALKGDMDMDIPRGTWTVSLDGVADSRLLGLPGPRLQAQVASRLAGPYAAPWGPYALPTGTLELSHGTLTQGTQRLDGLEASFSYREGRVGLQVGLEGRAARVLALDAFQVAPRRLSGSARLNLGPASADTPRLAAELTQNFMKDVQLDFQAQGSWGPGGLDYTGSLDHLQGRFEGFQVVQARPGRLDGDGSGVVLSVDLEGHTGPAPGPGPADPKAPPVTRMTLEGGIPFRPGGPLSLQVTGSAEMANLKTILDHVVHPGQYSLLGDMRPGGTARLNLHLGGTPADATLDGTLNVRHGRVSVSTFPQSIEDVDFTARFRGRDVFIEEADPLMGVLAQGALKAWGKASWQLDGGARYDLHAHLEDFQFRDLPEGFELLGSLDATLQGSERDGGLLKGTLQAKRVEYHADINLSDLMLANAAGATPSLAALDPSDPLARIDLDLDCHLAEPAEVDTNILKVRGRPDGPFRIMGTLAQPGLKGKVDLLPGGRFTSLLPTDVVLERGIFEFKDPSQFNPNVDLQGRVDVPPYVVMLGLSGTLDHLQATSTSTPSLRQDEIVAILIDPDAAQTVGTASALSSQGVLNTGLASGGTGLISSLALANFQEGLRKTLNLDRVNVALRTGTGSPETSITVGKSLNLFGYRTPLVFTHDKNGEVTTISGQMEWRFGNFVFSLGASQSTADSLAPSGEIRHSWSPR